MALFHRAILALTESSRENQGGIMRDEKGKKKSKKKIFYCKASWAWEHWLMTKGSLLFDVRWRSLNSPFGDWLKTRSYRTVCQISTFSYYSPLNFFLSLFYNKRRGMFSYSSIFYSSFKDHKQLTKETDCECVCMCARACTRTREHVYERMWCFALKSEQLRTSHKAITFQIFNRSI